MTEYYSDVSNLKKYFITNCKQIGVSSSNESYKIWANWLIMNLSNENNLIIPNIVGNDIKTKSLLIEKGGDKDKTIVFYNKFIEKVSHLYKKYGERKFQEKEINVSTNVSREYKIVSFLSNDCKIIISFDIYNKLSRQYVGPAHYLHENMFEMLFNYDILDGFSLQWSIPNTLFDSVEGELYASPINSHSNLYFSLFTIDKLFGSKDNVLNLKLLDRGIYEVNPPFIEKVFEESYIIIHNLLRSPVELTFIYIMPNWIDSTTYIDLSNSQYLKDKYIYKGYGLFAKSKRRDEFVHRT